MRFKINDKVIMPLADNKVGTIIAIERENESFNSELFYVIDAGEEFPYRYYEQDVSPIPKVEKENKEIKKILLVEDGSVDVDKLEADGFYVIVYRQGSTPPILLQSNDN